MRSLKHTRVLWGFVVVIAVAALAGAGADHVRKATVAPHELRKGDAPEPIVWGPPALPDSINIDTAEERHLKVVTVAKGLEQPWSIAFLPDGAMLVTERAGRLRIVRNGKLAAAPVDGVPVV